MGQWEETRGGLAGEGKLAVMSGEWMEVGMGRSLRVVGLARINAQAVNATPARA